MPGPDSRLIKSHFLGMEPKYIVLYKALQEIAIYSQGCKPLVNGMNPGLRTGALGFRVWPWTNPCSGPWSPTDLAGPFQLMILRHEHGSVNPTD